jgi:hypothetical protein
MYERRLEHSLYKTTAELQRLRLLREWTQSQDAAATEPERTPAPTVPTRAKQTQFPRHTYHPNHQSDRRLKRSRPPAGPEKQTQSNPIGATVLSGAQRSRTDFPHVSHEFRLSFDESPPKP